MRDLLASLQNPLATRAAAIGIGLGAGGLVLAVGLWAAPAAVLCVAAIALLAATQVGRMRGRSLAWTDFVGAALTLIGAALDGGAGALGGALLWFVLDAVRASAARGRMLAAAEAPGQAVRRRAHLWLLAAFAISVVAIRSPHVLLGLPVEIPHPPAALAAALGAALALSIVDWLVRELADWRLGEPRWVSGLNDVATLVAILAAFVLIDDVSAGVMGVLALRLARPAAEGLLGRVGQGGALAY